MIAYKIAAHAADLLRGILLHGTETTYPMRDSIFIGRPVQLSLDPQTAGQYHDETLPKERHKELTTALWTIVLFHENLSRYCKEEGTGKGEAQT